jgi:lysophospholipase L1-like esterase
VAANTLVYAIGDSLVGSEERPASPLFGLRRRLGNGADVRALGIGGETSAQVLARLDRDVIDQRPRPDICIVLAGVNDIQAGASSTSIVANLEGIYRKLLDAGLQPVAMTIYPFGNHHNWTPAGEATRQEVRMWMRTGLPSTLPAVDVVDVEDVLGDLTDRDRPTIRADYDDGTQLHLNNRGAARVAWALVRRSRSLRDVAGLRTGPRLSMS